MSFCGFFASCAAVETASKPMKAKNTTPAPRRMPLQPYFPNSPVFAGISGCQLAVLMKKAPSPMKATTTTSFTATMMLLSRADSLVPMTSKAVMAAMISAAGRLTMAVAVLPSANVTAVPGAAAKVGGMVMPTLRRMLAA